MVARPAEIELLIAALFSASLLLALVGAFFQPAVIAAIPDLAPPERLAAANSWIQRTAQAAVFVGQGIGGVLFRLAADPSGTGSSRQASARVRWEGTRSQGPADPEERAEPGPSSSRS